MNIDPNTVHLVEIIGGVLFGAGGLSAIAVAAFNFWSIKPKVSADVVVTFADGWQKLYKEQTERLDELDRKYDGLEVKYNGLLTEHETLRKENETLRLENGRLTKLVGQLQEEMKGYTATAQRIEANQ